MCTCIRTAFKTCWHCLKCFLKPCRGNSAFSFLLESHYLNFIWDSDLHRPNNFWCTEIMHLFVIRGEGRQKIHQKTLTTLEDIQEELLQALDELGTQLQQETQTTWDKWSCVSLASLTDIQFKNNTKPGKQNFKFLLVLKRISLESLHQLVLQQKATNKMFSCSQKSIKTKYFFSNILVTPFKENTSFLRTQWHS